MFGTIPDGYDLLTAEEIIMKKCVCPICRDEILLHENNGYRYNCKCCYTWTPGLFDPVTLVPLE